MESKETKDNLDLATTRKRTLPTSKEIMEAAYSVEGTLKLVNDYKLTAAELAELLNRLPTKAVPW